MTKEFKSVEKLEIGKDYINVYGEIIVIDRKDNCEENGFCNIDYRDDLCCVVPHSWREATEEEIIEAFERHLIHRYGEDWETMKIKEKHPDLLLAIGINNGFRSVKIFKDIDGWCVWNNNGLLYCNGIWVERLQRYYHHG